MYRDTKTSVYDDLENMLITLAVEQVIDFGLFGVSSRVEVVGLGYKSFTGALCETIECIGVEDMLRFGTV